MVGMTVETDLGSERSAVMMVAWRFGRALIVSRVVVLEALRYKETSLVLRSQCHSIRPL